MGAPKRTDVDWPRIHRLYQEGYSPYAIRQMLAEEGVSISRQAIMQRRDREGWKAPDGTQRPLPPKRPARKDNATTTTASAAAGKSAPPATTSPPSHNVASHVPPEQRVVLQSVALTGLTKHAALAAGVNEETFAEWCEDPNFADQLKQALGACAVANVITVQEAAQRGEWRAAVELLKTLPAFRDEFGEKDKGGRGGLTVNFKFELARGAKPDDADIITIEQDTRA